MVEKGDPLPRTTRAFELRAELATPELPSYRPQRCFQIVADVQRLGYGEDVAEKSDSRQADLDAVAAGYLNAFHRERSKRLKEQLAKQPKATLEQAMEQYDRIKRGSKRRAAN